MIIEKSWATFGKLVIGAVLILVGFGNVRVRLYAQLPNADSIAAYITAGEFGPALRLARQLQDPAERDRRLAEIARAQALLGARRASMATLLDIDSDLQRQQVTQQLAGNTKGLAGGGAVADFDTLINLITSTVAPDSWSDVGGSGAIEPYPTGVYVDASGTLHRLAPRTDNPLLKRVHQAARRDSGNRSIKRRSALRKVSLPRLEKVLQARHAFGLPPNESMQNLAGIYRIKYLLVYPETGDLVIAGPAGDWCRDAEGRVVNVETKAPVLQLDDVIVLLQNAYAANGRFGCAINPRQANLAAAQAFIDQWRNRAVRPNQRKQWVEQLRKTLGKQDIHVWGIDPTTHAARTIVEADYRMKLVGMGLEDGTLGVSSYLESAKSAGADALRGMSVLRWWFTPNYKSIRTTDTHNTFALDGIGVRVLCENEMLTEAGQRIHTGRSDPLSQQFADQFTVHFEALAAKYPIYADLRNLFDVALLAAVMHTEDLPGRIGWHMAFFRSADACQVRRYAAPREVDSVANYVVAERSKFVAGVSGGVSVDATRYLQHAPMKIDQYGRMEAAYEASIPQKLPADVWWWD